MSDFDWVKARSECSTAKVFEQIRLELESDVETRNAELAPDAKYKFETIVKPGKVVVVLRGTSDRSVVPHRSVTFNLTKTGISAKDNESKWELHATLTLNDEGECRLKVKGREREFWQFRRMALEILFFETV